ncbi:hypothetical protein ACSBR1_006767 [Camellia fascicularis]
MGLCNFPSPAEGLIHLLVMNTVLSVALLKNMVRSVLQVVGVNGSPPNSETNQSNQEEFPPISDNNGRARRVSTTRFKYLCNKRSCGGDNDNGNGNVSGCGIYGNMWCAMECCVCLCGFQSDEEVSELSYCKHFFHEGCLDKWFDNHHTVTCPLCRSIV